MINISAFKGPLAGLTVIDFGHYYAAPMAAMLLAEQGATVIRVVRSEKPELPDQQYRLLNRNKKLLMLDLKSEEGKRQALSLIGRADVLIENFRPGVMKRLGLDYVSLKQTNPGLVYLSLPGFASTDKKRAHIQAWEGVLGAAVGLFTDTHWMRQRLHYPPLYSWVPHCSAYGGMHGAIAVMAALVAREEHGYGTVIETPLVDAGLAGFTINCMAIGPIVESNELLSTLKPYEYLPGDDQAIQISKLDNATWNTVTPSGRVYLCADRRKILIWCVDGPFAWKFLKAIGLDQRVRRQGFVDAGLWDPYRADDNISASLLLRPELKEQLIQQIAELMLTKSAEEWEDLLAKLGLLAVVVRDRAEYLALEPMHASGVLVKMGEGEAELTVPGRIVDVSGPGGELINGFHEPEPITSAEADVLFARDVSRRTPVGKRISVKKGELLKKLKVLDLSNVVAGPVGAWVLAEYGAEVIKAAPPFYLHPLVLPQTVTVNQGKRSILLDLATAPGRRVFEQLVSWTDVVLHNCLNDTAERMGTTHRQLQSINPDVVSCQLSAFGGSYPGGWEGRRGFDPVACMATGMMAHYGTVEQPQPHGSTSCGDVMGGLCAAFATLVALYQQLGAGYGGEARTSLVRANNYIQLPYMIADKNGHSDWGEPHGQFAVGESWYQRLYQCHDGWIYVGAVENQSNIFAEIVSGNRGAEEKTLEAAFAKYECSYWLAKLGTVDIACHRVQSIADLRSQATLNVNNEAADETGGDECEALCWEEHPCGKPVTLMNPKQVRVGEERSYKRLVPAPRFGQHTKEILQYLGYSDQDISELIRIKAVHTCLVELGNEDSYFFEAKQQ